MLNFKDWLGAPENFPVPEDKFDQIFAKFYVEDPNRLLDGKVGFMNGKAKVFRVTYEYKGFKNMNLEE